VLVTTTSAVRVVKDQISGQAASRKVKKCFKDFSSRVRALSDENH
jgi:hypothetical protein